MSLINVTIDTATKAMSLNIDGVNIPNVEEFSAYKYSMEDSSDISCSFCVLENSGGFNKYTRYSSAQSLEAKEAERKLEAKKSDYKDFVETSNKDKVSEDIARFLRSGV